MKKTVTLVVTLVLVLALALPVSALSSSPTNKYDSGLFEEPSGRSYEYSCSVSATTTLATASMTYGKSGTNIGARIVARIKDSTGAIQNKENGDLSNMSASASVNNYVTVGNKTVAGTIVSATGNFTIYANLVSTLTVS